jgi:hypothetical protein
MQVTALLLWSVSKCVACDGSLKYSPVARDTTRVYYSIEKLCGYVCGIYILFILF